MNRNALFGLVVLATVMGVSGCSRDTTAFDAAPGPDDMNAREAGKDGGAMVDQRPPDQRPPDQLPPDQRLPDMFVPACPPWAVSAGGISLDSGYAVAVDGSGNTYVTGTYSGTAMFGGTTLTAKGLNDIFTARVDANGKF